MRVIVTTSFSGHPHGSWGTDRGRVQEMPDATAKMAIKAGFAKKAPPVKRATKRRAAKPKGG